MSDKITASDLQEMQDMIDGKSLLDGEELLHWYKHDLQRLVTAYPAAHADGIAAARRAVYITEMITGDALAFMTEKGGSLAAIDALIASPAPSGTGAGSEGGE